MKTKTKVIYILAILGLSLACSVAQSPPPAATEAPATIAPPVTIVIVTNTPTPQPTPKPGLPGSVIYDDGNNILNIDPNTGESTLLISRKTLEETLASDRSADSYTYGEKHPIAVSFSPDLSKALVTICADLDARYRCLFSDFVYTLDTQEGDKLPVPPDAYGVYWKWSPDGSKLAGAAWSYDRAIYYTTAFFAVNADGTNLTPLGPVVNDRWQLAWDLNSSVVHPLSYAMNFQSVFVDRSEPQDISLTGVDGNDRIECLSFSPDGNKVVFATRRNNPKNREWVYIANSDFTETRELTEYDLDPRYFCKVDWSPDGRFVHLRYEYDTRVETGEDKGGIEPRTDKLINVDTSTLLDTPRDLLLCGWTPDNNLVYETKTQDGGVQILTPGMNNPIEIPEAMQPAVLHCPVLWTNDQ